MNEDDEAPPVRLDKWAPPTFTVVDLDELPEEVVRTLRRKADKEKRKGHPGPLGE